MHSERSLQFNRPRGLWDLMCSQRCCRIFNFSGMLRPINGLNFENRTRFLNFTDNPKSEYSWISPIVQNPNIPEFHRQSKISVFLNFTDNPKTEYSLISPIIQNPNIPEFHRQSKISIFLNFTDNPKTEYSWISPIIQNPNIPEFHR